MRSKSTDIATAISLLKVRPTMEPDVAGRCPKAAEVNLRLLKGATRDSRGT
jgi:hypothetical protein